MWDTSLSLAQSGEALFSLSGINEINYKQLYKNDPYTSNSDDALKMETLDGEMDYTVTWILGAKT